MTEKTKFVTILFLAVVALFFSVGVRNASSVVQGGPHDMSAWGGSNYTFDTMEICVFCHTPHNSNTTQRYNNNPNNEVGGGSLNGQYLWNRRLPTKTNFTPYTSSTLNADTSQGPGTMSLLCLSCHDGVGAMSVLLNYPPDTSIPGQLTGFGDNQFGDAFNDPTIRRLNIGDADCTGDACTGGGELQNDHPIGFDYNTARTLDPTGLKVISDATILGRMAITGDRMECNTCHDPHLTNPDHNKFLVVVNTGSALCLACHNK